MTNQTRTEPLDRLAELEQAATPGPWATTYHDAPESPGACVDLMGPANPDDGLAMSIAAWVEVPDAAFIAALRNAAPSLIAEAREAARLRSALEQAEDIIEANPTEDVCRHDRYVFDCDEPDGCADRSRRETIRAALVKP